MKHFSYLFFLLIVTISQVLSEVTVVSNNETAYEDTKSGSSSIPSDEELCSPTALTQAISGNIQKVTATQFECYNINYQDDCSEEGTAHVLERGVVNIIEQVNGDGFGLLLTGDSVCFSWTYDYSSSLGARSECKEACVTLEKGKAEYDVEFDYATCDFCNPVIQSYHFVIKKGAASALVPLVSLVTVMVVALIL